jgi:hypothetical protein
MPKKSTKTYQIKVTLMNIRPPIWRRLLVNSDIKLDSFHSILQDAMGWANCHLHQFQQADVLYGMASEQEDLMDFGMQAKQEGQYRLSNLLKREKDSFFYEYDFGDSWRHKIVLEKILPLDKDAPTAKCIKGKRACPPEDCGGPWGYQALLQTLSDPSHEDFDEVHEWIGEEFDPERFDLARTNHLIEIQYSSDPSSTMH